MDKNISTIIIWAKNKPGVFFRILWLFRRKMFNIESATVGKTEKEGISRFTITVRGDDDEVNNMCKQVNKLLEVVKVDDAKNENIVAREMAMIKISVKKKTDKGEILRIVEHFRGRVINMTRDSIIIEVTGSEEKIDAFYENLSIYKILEFVRTGRSALYK